MTAEAFWYEGEGGLRLRAAFFRAEAPRRGAVVLNSGRTEFIEKYVEVIGELRTRGFDVLTHDWRGQGLSQRLLPGDPLKGHARGWRPFIADFRRLMALMDDKLPGPRIALGHSMGGALTCLALLEKVGGFDAAVLSSPMLGVNTAPFPVPAARLIARAMCLAGRAEDWRTPGEDPLVDRFEGNRVTRHRPRWTRTLDLLRAYPDLALAGDTWGWVDFALNASAEIRRRAGELAHLGPNLAIVAAGAEQLADNSASEQVARTAGAPQPVEIAAALHELLMEEDPVRAQFWDVFDKVAARVAPTPPGPG